MYYYLVLRTIRIAYLKHYASNVLGFVFMNTLIRRKLLISNIIVYKTYNPLMFSLRK